MNPTITLSERLCVGTAGLLRFNPSSGHYYAVHGLKTYNPNGFIHPLTDPFPMDDNYLASLDISSHERRRNTAARKQCVRDMGMAFAFMASIAATGWLINHYLL